MLFLRYLNVYQKYSNLLDHAAKQEVSAFLKEKHSLEGFRKVIKWFHLNFTLNFLCFHAGLCCVLAPSKSSLPHSILRKSTASITCGKRLPHCTSLCLCPCFACMLAIWMMTCVTALRDWKTRSLRSKWRRTESLTKGERKLSATLNLCNFNNRKYLLDWSCNLFLYSVSPGNQLHTYLKLSLLANITALLRRTVLLFTSYIHKPHIHE